ncbi:hypothetical protein D3C87_1858080 [compost metagenome]
MTRTMTAEATKASGFSWLRIFTTNNAPSSWIIQTTSNSTSISGTSHHRLLTYWPAMLIATIVTLRITHT